MFLCKLAINKNAIVVWLLARIFIENSVLLLFFNFKFSCDILFLGSLGTLNFPTNLQSIDFRLLWEFSNSMH
jgi:hypothetical protein